MTSSTTLLVDLPALTHPIPPSESQLKDVNRSYSEQLHPVLSCRGKQSFDFYIRQTLTPEAHLYIV